MKSTGLITLAGLSLLATSASAQAADPPALPITGPVLSYVLDEVTGIITPTGSLPNEFAADAPQSGFSNASASGSYVVIPSNNFYVDWGVKSSGLTGEISEVVIGYATSALDPSMGGPGAQFRFRLYQDSLGFCTTTPDQPGTKVYGTNLVGLPGSPDGVTPVGIMLTVQLESPVNLPDGPVGWGYGYSDGKTGPMLISVGLDGTGTIDAFDRYNASGTCIGTSTFTTPGIASFYLELTEDDGAPVASATLRNGNGTNPADFVSLTLPVLGQTWNSQVVPSENTVASIIMIAVYPSPAPFPHPYGPGEILLDLAPFPNFDVSFDVIGGSHGIQIPDDESLSGKKVYTQALRVELDELGLQLSAMNGLDLELAEQ